MFVIPSHSTELNQLRDPFEKKIVEHLKAADSLQDKYFQALDRLEKAATSSEVREAIQAVKIATQAGEKVPTSSYAELENLNRIMREQSAMQTRQFRENLENDARQYHAAVTSLRSKLSGTASDLLKDVDQELARLLVEGQQLASGELPWSLDNEGKLLRKQSIRNSEVPLVKLEGQSTAEKTWPRLVVLDDAPEVTVVEENFETKTFIYRSANYEFVSDSRLGANVVREFGRIFEATYLANCKLPIDIRPQPERLKNIFTARLFTNKDDYFAAGGIEGSAGVYSTGLKCLMVPLSSLGVKMVGSRVSLDYRDQDQQTLIHEITHQMMNHWLGKMPVWMREGAADFVAAAPYDRGKFNFGQIHRRLPEMLSRRGFYNGEVLLPDLETLMNIDSQTWAEALKQRQGGGNYLAAFLLYYYFCMLDADKDGKHVVAYYDSIRENGLGAEQYKAAIHTHLLRERSYEQLTKEFVAAMRSQGVKVSFLSSSKKAS